MAKAKTRKKPSRKKRPKKKGPSLKGIKLAAVGLFVALTISAAISFIFLRQPAVRTSSKKAPASIQKHPPKVVYEEPEISSQKTPPAKKTQPHPPKEQETIPGPETASPKPFKPKVAIIIDDMGHQKTIGKRFISLDLDLTFSFLPYAPYTEMQTRLAQEHGRVILLHLPMEPSDSKWDPGPNALYINMSREKMLSIFNDNLSLVPMAEGINNHMGSRFTRNMAAMRIVLGGVKARNLFYIDSVTTSYSVGQIVADDYGIKNSKRDIFLDNVQDTYLIQKQLDALMQVAARKGSAIGIGHPHQSTLKALKNYRKKLRSEVNLVGVNELIH